MVTAGAGYQRPPPKAMLNPLILLNNKKPQFPWAQHHNSAVAGCLHTQLDKDTRIL
jgi:hypothetical protein